MTHVTDGVTDDIVWIQGTRMSWFNTRLWPEKRKKSMHNIYVLYILYAIFIVYILYAYYIYIHFAYICKVKTVRYINRTSFTHILGDPRNRWCYG